MLSLREAQTQFAAAVLDGSDPVYAVYRNNVRTCLGRALADAYPVVERLVGEEFFRHTAYRYIAQHPSRSGDLNAFGWLLTLPNHYRAHLDALERGTRSAL